VKLGRATTVLVGEQGGKYPHGNSLLVEGAEESLVVDPSLTVAHLAEAPRADRVVNSHCHEDHVAGNHRYPSASWHLPDADLPGIASVDGLMAIYGFDGPVDDAFRRVVVDQFHFTPRADAVAYRDGDVFDLGGGVRVRAIHAPGHTRGHSLLHVEPDDVLYLGDIDLSSFGPYYGDAWSSLEDFERTLAMVRDMPARWYATFHHVGVLEGQTAFRERLDRFAAVIGRREAALLDYLAEPHSLDEIAAHRFVYRPADPVSFAEPVERRSMGQHVARLVAAGRVAEVEPGRFAVR
jgi:glyoxylase-like metal-dependent hydrolase (beta-lactamase superfamily II)